MELSMSQFDHAFQYVIKNEGGFSNRIDDRGGATNFGITQKTLSRWRGTSVSVDDVKNLTLTEAKAIYEKFYWNAMNCNQLASGVVATALFDVGVNMGGTTAIGLMQKALDLKITNHLDEDTLVALETKMPIEILSQFVPAVQNRYIDIVLKNPTQIKFLKGWLRRSQRLIALLT
ncbi:MAG: hypothetical protein E6R03_02255 [Hyphomicrobiaceae bacterium]|nr:MAG: hypothetical protein E6R03_02255 [Hyphomicrobiaceae bacterium]